MRNKRRTALTGLMFILPGIVGMGGLIYLPMLYSMFLSFTEWGLVGRPEWVGLANYGRMLTESPLFWKGLRNTIYYAVLFVPLRNVVGLSAALLLNRDFRGRSIFRTAFYLPSIVPIYASAILWLFVLNPRYGFINQILMSIGVDGPLWLWNEQLVIPSLVAVGTWGFGPTMVIYLAGLAGMPSDLYDAVEIDGGGRMRKFFNVTLPLLSPVVFFNVIMSTITALQEFATPYLMTQGGPNNASLLYALLLYRTAFRDRDMGSASALAWVLFIIAAVVTFFYFRIAKRAVYYEGAD